ARQGARCLDAVDHVRSIDGQGRRSGRRAGSVLVRHRRRERHLVSVRSRGLVAGLRRRRRRRRHGGRSGVMATIHLRASLIASGDALDEGDPVVVSFPEHDGPPRTFTLYTIEGTPLVELAEMTYDRSEPDPYTHPAQSWIFPGTLRLGDPKANVDASAYF